MAAVLQPADLKERRGRWLQRARRTTIALCWVWLLAIPLWHMARGARWTESPALPSPPLWGAPWTVKLGPLELLDPLAAASLLTAGVAEVWLVISALPLLLATLLLGRFFCGWVCPYLPFLGASNAARALLARAGLRLPDVRLPRWASAVTLSVLLLGSAAAGMQLLMHVYPPALLGKGTVLLLLHGAGGGALIGVAAIFLFDTFVSRGGFCRSLCPGGALFSALGAPSPVTVVREAHACTECTACDVVCHLGQQPMSDLVATGCERCGRCIASCPTGALRFGTHGMHAVGVPQLRPPPS